MSSCAAAATATPADRGGMGVRRPRRHEDALVLRRRGRQARPIRLVRRQLRRSNSSVGEKEKNPWGLYDMYATYRSGSGPLPADALRTTALIDRLAQRGRSIASSAAAHGTRARSRPALRQSALHRLMYAVEGAPHQIGFRVARDLETVIDESPAGWPTLGFPHDFPCSPPHFHYPARMRMISRPLGRPPPRPSSWSIVLGLVTGAAPPER